MTGVLYLFSLPVLASIKPLNLSKVSGIGLGPRLLLFRAGVKSGYSLHAMANMGGLSPLCFCRP